MTDPRLLVAGLLLVDSLYFIFARLLLTLVPPAAGAMYMLVLGAVEIAVLMRGCVDFTVLRRHAWLFAAVGGLVGVNTNMGFVAVKYVDPGTASLLSRAAILFGVGLGLVWLGDRLSRLEVIGAAIALAGVIAISVQPGDYLRWGSLLVITSTLLYAIHSAMVRSATAATFPSASSCSSGWRRWRPFSSCWRSRRARWCGRRRSRGAGW